MPEALQEAFLNLQAKVGHAMQNGRSFRVSTEPPFEKEIDAQSLPEFSGAVLLTTAGRGISRIQSDEKG
jgi:hypothetical protein